MWNGSHETSVDCLKRYIKAWKMRGPAGDGSKGHWSDESIADFIVEGHERIDGPAKTGIVFPMPGSGDENKRRKAIAMRIGRYLTDEPNTEFEALQLLNLLPSILVAIPRDLASKFLNEYLSDVDFTVRGTDRADGNGLAAATHIANVSREASDAVGAIAKLIDGATPAELSDADRELAEAEEAIRAARASVRQQMSLKVVA